jgi:hypothetical protein
VSLTYASTAWPPGVFAPTCRSESLSTTLTRRLRGFDIHHVVGLHAARALVFTAPPFSSVVDGPGSCGGPTHCSLVLGQTQKTLRPLLDELGAIVLGSHRPCLDEGLEPRALARDVELPGQLDQ